MNLSTARSEKRAKEVGIRKSIGSRRSQLIHQFFSESLLYAVFSFVVAILFIQLFLPTFNQLADKDIPILWANPWFWGTGLLFTVFTGFLAGIYPAYYLASFRAIKVLKGNFRVGPKAANPRKALIVFQFTISIALIIGTVIVYQQIQHVKNRPVGYSQEGLITFPNLYGKYDLLRRELRETGVVVDYGEASYPLTNNLGNNNGFEWPGKAVDFDPSFNTVWVSYDYGAAIDWEIIEGRDFSRTFKSDALEVILSQSAVEVMGLKNPVDTYIKNKWEYLGGGERIRVIGVVQDMIKGSPYLLKPESPAMFFRSSWDLNWSFVKIKPSVSPHEALSQIEAVFSRLFPDKPFEYQFVDDQYNLKFRSEQTIGKLAFLFAWLAIFISCLGLLGLAFFMAERRSKEIAIRKVLGATVYNLWRLLSKEFISLVLFSSVLAAPLAYYFMYRWLQNYEYRIGISWRVFVVATFSALLITLLTVSFQSLKAAMANPVDSLRSE